VHSKAIASTTGSPCVRPQVDLQVSSRRRSAWPDRRVFAQRRADARSASNSSSCDLRHQRCTLRRSQGLLSLSTVGRLMKAWALGRMKNLDPKRLVRRITSGSARECPWSTLKQLARFERVGHSIPGPSSRLLPRCRLREGTCRDRTTPPPGLQSRCLADEQKAKPFCFLARASMGFSEQGHLSPDPLGQAPSYRSMTGEKLWALI